MRTVHLPLKSKISRDTQRFNLELPLFELQKSGRRALIVADRVPNDDIDSYSGILFDESPAGRALHAAVQDANEESGRKLGNLCFINFHEFRVHKLSPSLRQAAEADFASRVEKAIGKFKPDVIIALGIDPAVWLLDKEADECGRLFGRVIPYPNNPSIDFLWTLGVFDIAPDVNPANRKAEMKKLQAQASLTGIVMRHMMYAFNPETQPTVDKTPPQTRFINTIEKFDAFFSLLKKPDQIVSIDTETASLGRVDNQLLTMQFCFGPTKAYFLPYDHPDSPWTKEERTYITHKLKTYFERGASKYHIYQNAKFDLTVIKQQLGVQYYCHDIWDISSAEYALEENWKFVGELKHLKHSPYRLDYIACRYGWDAYKNAGVDKDSRKGFREMKAKKFLNYALLDVIIPWRVHKLQIWCAAQEGWDIKIYKRAVLKLLSDMSHVFSEMEHRGHLVDKNYLIDIMRPGGEVENYIKERKARYRKSRAAQRVNERLLRASGAPKKTLFGGKAWEFNINTVAHQQALFFDELELEPLRELKLGGGAVDKAFQKKYSKRNDDGKPADNHFCEEVEWFAEMKKFKTLKSNFIDTVWKRALTEPDMKKDGHLRSNYNFIYIVTGRSGSRSINFQNIPNHGEAAKIIKKMFRAKPGNLFLKVDFGAHEVRNWANVSGDDLLAGRFIEALKLKKQFILETDPVRLAKVAKLLKTRGDIHIQNVKFFFDKWVDKKHPLRQRIKAVVFGVIYGKQAFSLASDINGTEEEAQELIDKLFSTYKKGGDWLQEVIRLGQEEYIVESPFGLRRHLWGHMLPDIAVQRAMDRRGPNAIIQGASSQMGYMSGRNLQNLRWEFFQKQNYDFNLTHNNSVHDSLETETAIRNVPLALYLIEHAMTTQVARRTEEDFGWPLQVDLDVEFDIGSNIANVETWDNRWENLEELVEKKVKEAQDLYSYKVPKQEIRAFRHNLEVVTEVRKKEVARELKEGKWPVTRMDMTPKDMKEFDLCRMAA